MPNVWVEAMTRPLSILKLLGLLLESLRALTSGGIYLLDSEAQGGRDMAKFQAVGFSVQHNISLLRLIVRHAVDGQHEALC